MVKVSKHQAPASGYRVRYYPDVGPPELSPDVYQHQTCVCGHARRSHSEYLGGGRQRYLILDCLHAGSCCEDGCDCGRFVFSTAKATEAALKNRRREQDLFEVVPPASVVRAKK